MKLVCYYPLFLPFIMVTFKGKTMTSRKKGVVKDLNGPNLNVMLAGVCYSARIAKKNPQ
jgi:hypothetical protein